MTKSKKDIDLEIAKEAKIYTAQEVADLLQLDLKSIYKIIAREELNAVKVLNEWRIKHSDLVDYINQLQTNQKK